MSQQPLEDILDDFLAIRLVNELVPRVVVELAADLRQLRFLERTEQPPHAGAALAYRIGCPRDDVNREVARILLEELDAGLC